MGGAWSVPAAKVPGYVDVAELRRSVPGRLTQQAFAKVFGFSFATVRDWEQGRRKPDRVARLVLHLIATDAAWVRRALGSA